MKKCSNKLKFRKIIFPLCIVGILVGSIAAGFVAAHNMPYPIPISSEDEFYSFTKKYQDGYFVLKKQITFTEPIKPIGDKDHPFRGMINGGEYNLDNVVIDATKFNDSYLSGGKLYIGLFPFNEGVIFNLNISNLSFLNFENIDNKYQNVVCGGICGQNNGRISNSSLFSSNISINCETQNFTFGSISGENRCEIHKCKMLQNITFTGQVNSFVCGGITGLSVDGLTERCLRKGWIGLKDFIGNDVSVGGICGVSTSSNFFDCAMYDNFYGNNVGFNFYDSDIAECYIGGICGLVLSGKSSTVIKNSYCNPTIVISNIKSLIAGLVVGNANNSAEVRNVVVSARANIQNVENRELNDVWHGDYSNIHNSFFLKPLTTNTPFNEILSKVSLEQLSTSMLGWDDSFWSITDRIECKL